MKKILVFLSLIASLLIVPVVANAAVTDPFVDTCSKEPAKSSTVCAGKGETLDKNAGKIINTLIYIVGAISVVAIIIGGIMYVTSSGSPENVTKAKNTVLYAVIGLVVTALSYAIVYFVIGRF